MITIKGSYVGNRRDTVRIRVSLLVRLRKLTVAQAEAIEFFRRGLIKAPFKTVPLSDLAKVYELMEQGKIAGRYVLDLSK